MNKPQSLDAALKSAQTILKEYVRALVSENLKLQKQVAQLYAKNVSKDHLIASLKAELQKVGHKDPSDELAERIRAGRARVAQRKEHEPTL
jgi:peptidoglycan hydrolase CwlO-like protein